MSGFTGKKVLIIGASSGIGRGIADAFAAAGATLAITARDAGRIATVAREIAAASTGAQVLPFALDLADPASVREQVALAAKAMGGIDVLCANAGIYPSAGLEEMSVAQWDEVLHINTRGTFLGVQAALPHLRASQAGRIILTSSITGPLTAIAGLSHYGASKAAQLGFMRAAALELAPHGITINAVLPGVICTESLQGLGQQFIESSARLVPLKRLGTPADIAHAALFFAAPESGFITGQTLVVDGGQTLPEAPESI